MMNLQGILPAGKRWRELWLPQLINDTETELPSSVKGGHPLALTGAKKGTTANGVHFTGAADSLINCGVIHNAVAKLWVSLRFKLDQPYSAGASSGMYLFSKFVDGDNRIDLMFENVTGRLQFRLRTAATDRFVISAQDAGGDITSWNANQWYHVLASISDTAGVGRLIVDGGPVVLTNDVNPAPNGGIFTLSNYTDPGSPSGFKGTSADVIVGTDDLTTDEEANLYKGMPPSDAVNFWPLDEGRGTTAYDRGSGGNNGTLDTTATWNFDGQPRLAALSLDGINDRGNTALAVDMSGDITIMWIGKMKIAPTADSFPSNPHLYEVYIDDFNFAYIGVLDGYRLYYGVRSQGGTTYSIAKIGGWAIDNYLILLGTVTAAGSTEFFVNGISMGTWPSGTIPPIAHGGARVVLGCGGNLALYFGTGKALLAGLIDGALTAQEAKVLSRYYDQKMGLGLGI